jgi:hypothetical protein
MRRKNKGFRNKDPRYFEKLAIIKKGLRWFFTNQSKKQLGIQGKKAIKKTSKQ